MRLSAFITASSKQIVAEWAEFARISVPAASDMDLTARRDHIEGMLRAIALDIETPQTSHEQGAKSKGGTEPHAKVRTSAASHGTDRAVSGFSVVEMVSEFRALRASVLRLWAEAQEQFTRENLQEVTRFNEAIDQLLAESMVRYTDEIEGSKEMLLGVLGHDLRNPLGAIMTGASLMLMREGPEWKNASTASRILNSGRRMDGMIRDLLDFTRSRLGGGIPVVRTEMELVALCRETVDEITAFHPTRIVKVEATGELRGEWDSGRIAQVISNLVGNAFQHGKSGSPVTVTVRGERDDALVTVHNEGPAIPPPQLREIFSPFRQVAPHAGESKDVRSAGLGLYIAEAIATAHQGSLDVESTDRGTTFTLRVPRSSSRPAG